MSFISSQFFLFFIAVTVLLILADHFQQRFLRHLILAVANLIFYAMWDVKLLFLLLGMILIVYFCGKNVRKKPIYLKLGVILLVFVLFLFKYYQFFVQSFVTLFHITDLKVVSLLLPLGISYYIFLSISYLVDIHDQKTEPQSLLNTIIYISYFPSIIAGPITKARDFFKQLDADCVTKRNVAEGIQIFTIGMFKKRVLADHLYLFTTQVFAKPEIFHWQTLLLAVLSNTLLLYFDFSGYSDMAIGISRIMGIELQKNFNLPYISKNISEFWKRWHISLSQWLMTYIYIPLGGNRKGVQRQFLNLMITMTLGGLWHGADWTFVFWGAVNGAALIVHKIWRMHTHQQMNPVLSPLLTFAFVNFSWIFFSASTIQDAFHFIGLLCQGNQGVVHHYVWVYLSFLLLVIFTWLSYNSETKKAEGKYFELDFSHFWELTIFFIFLGITIGLAYTGSNPFIYAQF